MERPTCGNCLHFHRTDEAGKEPAKGECHGVPPAVVAIKNEAKTVFPDVTTVMPGCPNHKDIVTFEASQVAAANTPKVASGIREDGKPHLRPEQVRQAFPCHCIRLGPDPDNRAKRVRLTIPGDTRIITALRACASCHGTGRPDAPMLGGMPAMKAPPRTADGEGEDYPADGGANFRRRAANGARGPAGARGASGADDIPLADDVPPLSDAERTRLLNEVGEMEIPDPEVEGEQILGDNNEPLPGKDWTTPATAGSGMGTGK